MEYRGGKSKATTLSQSRGAGVDRLDRPRARSPGSRSPDHGRSPRHRQSQATRRNPSPRGHKRPRDDRDRYANGARVESDPRRFRVHYEDSRDRNGQSRLSYDDDDRPSSQSAATLHYDDQDWRRKGTRDRSRDRELDRYAGKHPRNRSRSADHASRGNAKDRHEPRRHNERAVRNGHGDGRNANTYDSPVPGRSRREPPSGAKHNRADSITMADAPPTPLAVDDRDFEEEKPVDVEAEIERRRRRREELLAKSRGGTPMLVQALETSAKAVEAPPASTTRANTPMAVDTPGSGTCTYSKSYPKYFYVLTSPVQLCHLLRHPHYIYAMVCPLLHLIYQRIRTL